jgi:hypothetical protein
MIQSILIFLSFLIPYQSGFKHIWTVPVKGEILVTDNLGNPIVIQGDALTKFRDNGTLFRLYSNKRLGKISSVDAMNPLKIVVFYKDFSRVLFLDNTLTENGTPIELEKMELEQASQVCASYDNGVWVFDGVEYTLTRFNQQMQKTVQILNLNQILNYALQPVFMMEHDNHLYMSVPDRGILQFDIFGTYIRTIPIIGINRFQVLGTTLYYFKTPGLLQAFQIKTLQESQLELPVKDYIDMRINQDRLYLLRNDSLSVYQFPASTQE